MLKFKLNEYHQGVTNEELISDVVRVSSKFGDSYLSIKKYESVGIYGKTTFRKRFGSWANVLEEAGLRSNRSNQEMKRISDDMLIVDVLRIAKMLGKDSVSTIDYCNFGNYSLPTIVERFGNWASFIEKAKLQPTNHIGKISDERLFEEIERIWLKLGKQPTTTEMKMGISKYGLDTFTRRFGGWRNALSAFLQYMNDDENDMEAQILDADSYQNIQTAKNETEFDKPNNSSNNASARHLTPRNANLRLRFKVLNRDYYKCCICGRSPAKDPSVELHVDHIKPWSKGGETIIDNLQTLCSKCNLGKSDLLL